MNLITKIRIPDHLLNSPDALNEYLLCNNFRLINTYSENITVRLFGETRVFESVWAIVELIVT